MTDPNDLGRLVGELVDSARRAGDAIMEIYGGDFDVVAKADDSLHPGELEYLRHVSQIFGFSEGEFQRIRASHFGPDREDPYVILGVEHGISDEDLRRAYHRLVRENHPDSMIARGVPEEFVKLANEKLASINGAYDIIKKQRGITG